MRNDHQGARPGVQEGLQFLQGIDIEIVGGLVQQQYIGLGHQYAGELQAAALATRKVAYRGALTLGGKS